MKYFRSGAGVPVLSGVYTPTLTNVANVDASTAYECQYQRIGNTVTVSGKVDIDPTLTLTLTKLGISLPIASTLGAEEKCAGIGSKGMMIEVESIKTLVVSPGDHLLVKAKKEHANMVGQAFDKFIPQVKTMVHSGEIEDVQVIQAPTDKGEISDGYHTFNELYFHRNLLFINLCLQLKERACWKPHYPGWPILFLELPTGQISYHIPEDLLPLIEGKIPRNDEMTWDGHSSEMVLEKLRQTDQYE